LDVPEEAATIETSAERAIYRLSYEVAELRSKLARAGLAPDADRVSYRAYSSLHGWTESVDPIACLARGFASRLAEVTCIRSMKEPGDDDVVGVNAHIAMVAEEADSLISALVKDAEAKGLEASGAWLKIPLVECRAFELPDPADPATEEVDFIHDQKLNS
jgi:hypothetical protein